MFSNSDAQASNCGEPNAAPPFIRCVVYIVLLLATLVLGSVPDPKHFETDPDLYPAPDPDPALSVSCMYQQKSSVVFYVFGTVTLVFKDNKSLG
jgi:hypothetical protein